MLPQGCSRHVLPGTGQPPDLRARPMQCGWRWCRVGSAVRGPPFLRGTAELLSGCSRAVCSGCRVPWRRGSPRCLLPGPALGVALDRPPQRAGAGGGCGTLTGVCRTQRVLAPIWGSLLLVVSCLLARSGWSSRCSRAGTMSGSGCQRSSELHPQPQPHQPRLSLRWKSVSQCRCCYHLPTCGSILHLPGSPCPTSSSRADVTPQSCPGMRAHCGAHRTRDHQREAGGLWDHV